MNDDLLCVREFDERRGLFGVVAIYYKCKSTSLFFVLVRLLNMHICANQSCFPWFSKKGDVPIHATNYITLSSLKFTCILVSDIHRVQPEEDEEKDEERPLYCGLYGSISILTKLI